MYQNKDVFQGLSVPKAIAKFAIPTILSQLVTLLYNLADTFFVGHTNDPSQVAALTLSFPLFMSLTNAFVFLSSTSSMINNASLFFNIQFKKIT
mgnify:CR=1 FL=1